MPQFAGVAPNPSQPVQPSPRFGGVAAGGGRGTPGQGISGGGAQPATTVQPGVQPGISGGGAQPGAPATQAPPSVTVDPRDASYYDQLSRLNYAYQNSLAGYNRGLADNTAGYNSTTGALNQQIPITLSNERAKANSQGLLESGILAQRAGGDLANYSTKMGAALSRENAANQAASDRWTAAQNAFNAGSQGALDATIARAGRADLANQPVTPAPAKPPTVGQALQKAAKGTKKAAIKQIKW